MVLNSRLKWVGLVGLVLSAISLFIHFLLARFTDDGYIEYQSSIIVFSWRPIFGNSNFPRNVMCKYTYLPRSMLSFRLLYSIVLSLCFETRPQCSYFLNRVFSHFHCCSSCFFCCLVPEFLLLGCLWDYDFVLVLRNQDINVVLSSWVLSSWIFLSALCLLFSMDLFLSLFMEYNSYPSRFHPVLALEIDIVL